MKPESQEDLIESLEDIIDAMRAILIQPGDDPAILSEAREALSDWLANQYVRRPQLRLIEGGGEGTGRLF